MKIHVECEPADLTDAALKRVLDEADNTCDTAEQVYHNIEAVIKTQENNLQIAKNEWQDATERVVALRNEWVHRRAMKERESSSMGLCAPSDSTHVKARVE